jgi:hypothetical protein
LVCIGIGVGISALTGYPLYLGVIIGWLCPALLVMMVMLPRLLCDKIGEAYRRRTDRSLAVNWHEQNDSKNLENLYSCLCDPCDGNRGVGER